MVYDFNNSKTTDALMRVCNGIFLFAKRPRSLHVSGNYKTVVLPFHFYYYLHVAITTHE